MKSKLLGLAAGILFAANSAAQAVTFGLPLNGSVFFSGTPNPLIIPQVNINFLVTGPSFDPPCATAGFGSPCSVTQASGLVLGTFISQFDQAGHEVSTAILAEFFSNMLIPHTLGTFGLDVNESELDSTLSNLASFSLVISTTIFARSRNVHVIPSPDPLTITLADGFAETSTPLPASLPLFITGLGTLGLLGWRRKRKVAVIAAARP